MPFCPNCGEYVSEGSSTCSCGTSIDVAYGDADKSNVEEEMILNIKSNREMRLRVEAAQLKDLGKHKEAIEKYKEALDTVYSGKTLMDIGDVYFEMDDFDEAIHYYRLSKQDGAAKKIARSLTKLGRFSQAIDFLTEEIENTRNSSRYHVSFNRNRAHDKDYVERYNESCMQTEREMNEALSRLYNELGWVHYLENSYDEAIECYEMGIRLDNEFSSNWNCKAIALEAMGMYAEAVKFYDIALRVSEGDEIITENLRHCLEVYGREYSAGRYTKKSEYLKLALKAWNDEEDIPIIWGSRNFYD